MHSSQAIQQILSNFVLVKLDAAAPEAKQVEDQGIPLLVFFSPAGQEIARQLGGMAEDKLATLLESVVKK